MATFKEALLYPTNNSPRIFNFWWVLVPVWGWFVVGGYTIRIWQNIWKKKPKMPSIKPWDGLFTTGFYVFVIGLLLGFASAIGGQVPIIGPLLELFVSLYGMFLYFQFAHKANFAAAFEFKKAWNSFTSNLPEVIITFLKSIGLTLVWLAASVVIITIPYTIPALAASNIYLWGDFYKNCKKK